MGLLLAERFINLPVNIVPTMHTELPLDLDFTKLQKDVKDPKEFDYQYLLVMSRFTTPTKGVPIGKNPKKEEN